MAMTTTTVGSRKSKPVWRGEGPKGSSLLLPPQGEVPEHREGDGGHGRTLPDLASGSATPP